MAKIALLRNSYQNRSNICLSILWAIGQGGLKQITEAIKGTLNYLPHSLHVYNVILWYIYLILQCGKT